MKFRTVLSIVLLLSASRISGYAQELSNDPLANAARIVMDSTGTPIVSSEPLMNVLPPVLCDSDGNSYFQIMDKLGGSTVLRLGTDAKVQAFKLPDDTGSKESLSILGFTVSGTGDVSLVAQATEKSKIAHRFYFYSKTGEVISKADLSKLFLPNMLIATDSGQFLIIGRVLGSVASGTISMAIMDKNGMVVRDLASELKSMGTKTDDPSTLREPTTGNARLADDHNIYMFVPGQTPRINVVSQAGIRIRSLELSAPFKDAAMFDFRVGFGRILVGYYSKSEFREGTKTPKSNYVAYNTTDGSPVAIYTIGSHLRGTLGCMLSADEVSFVTGTKDGYFAVYHVNLK